MSTFLVADTTVALLLLPKLLPTVANTRTLKGSELEHIKSYKALLDAPVSSALVQIVPVSMPFLNNVQYLSLLKTTI